MLLPLDCCSIVCPAEPTGRVQVQSSGKAKASSKETYGGSEGSSPSAAAKSSEASASGKAKAKRRATAPAPSGDGASGVGSPGSAVFATGAAGEISLASLAAGGGLFPSPPPTSKSRSTTKGSTEQGGAGSAAGAAAAATSVAAAAASLIVPKMTQVGGASSENTTARHLSPNSKSSAYAKMAKSAIVANNTEPAHVEKQSERVIQTPIRGGGAQKNSKSGMLSPTADLRNCALTFSKSASLLSRSFLSQSSVTNLYSDEDE